MKYFCDGHFERKICGKDDFVCAECLATWPYKNKIEELEDKIESLEKFKKDATDSMLKISKDFIENNPWTTVPTAGALIAKDFLIKHGDK